MKNMEAVYPETYRKGEKVVEYVPRWVATKPFYIDKEE